MDSFWVIEQQSVWQKEKKRAGNKKNMMDKKQG